MSTDSPHSGSNSGAAKRKASELDLDLDNETTDITDSKEAAPLPTVVRSKAKATTITSFFQTNKDTQPMQKKSRAPSGIASTSLGGPRSVVTVPKLNSIPFSLSAFQESLTTEQKCLLQLEYETMALSW